MAGCSGGNGGTADAALPDGRIADGGLTGPFGAWAILSATRTFDDGGTRTIGSTGDPRVNGTLEVAAGGEYAFAQKYVLDGGLVRDDAAVDGRLDKIAIPPSGSFALQHSPAVPFAYTPPPAEALTIHPDATHALALARLTPSATDTMQIRGTVRLLPGAAIACPRAALVFLVRPGTGDSCDADHSCSYDVRDDEPLTFVNGVASLNMGLDRKMAPVGTERIVFGTAPMALMAVALVVVYDDDYQPGVDAGVAGTCSDGKLEVSSIANSCTTPGQDCVKGVSEIVLAYRFGSSPQLAASTFAYVRPQWTQTRMIVDIRNGTGKPGLISLDPATPVPFDVLVPAVSSQLFVPVFPF